MQLYVNGAEESLPVDWRVHIVLEGNRTRVTVERDGRWYSLADALALRDILVTSSRKELRQPHGI